MKLRFALVVSFGAILLAHAAQAQLGPARFKCAGSEPFWSIEIGAAGKATFDAPEAALKASGTSFTGHMSVVENRNPAAWMWRGSAQPGAKDLVAAIVPTACPEPSGENAPYTVWLMLPDGKALTGCCRQ